MRDRRINEHIMEYLSSNCAEFSVVLPSLRSSSQYQYRLIWIFILFYRFLFERENEKKQPRKISELVFLISLTLSLSVLLWSCVVSRSHKWFSNLSAYFILLLPFHSHSWLNFRFFFKKTRRQIIWITILLKTLFDAVDEATAELTFIGLDDFIVRSFRWRPRLAIAMTAIARDDDKWVFAALQLERRCTGRDNCEQ